MGLFKRILGDLSKSNVGNQGSLPGTPPPRTYPKPSSPGEWDEERDVQETMDEDRAFRELQNMDLAEQMLASGEWIDTPVSSNVASFRWQRDNDELQVRFKDGSFYGYFEVTWPEAVGFLHQDSKGKAIWDRMRIRGTKLGHRKPYVYYSGPSNNNRKWYQAGADASAAHGRKADRQSQSPSASAFAKGGLGRKRGKRK